ncbi:MAG: hypothetical protein IJP92_06900 [Lachnospiraceae bacterium]|nr:hypothetical protein [Lachnospiraceae bacterium]
MRPARSAGSEQRRAMNLIWNAAGRYDFDVPFMAFQPDGRADFYFNSVIGLSEKWLDADQLNTFFSSYAHSVHAEAYDALLWLGVENCLYEKELPERPMLTRMRGGFAERFFLEEQTLSRQEMMAHNPRVYEQQQARWAFVTGRKPSAMTPGAKRLREALLIPGSAGTKELVTRLQDILIEFFRFRGFRLSDAPEGFAISASLGEIVRNFMRRDSKQHDSLIVRGTGTAADVRAPLGSRMTLQRSAEDADYIRSCFGPCLYDDMMMRTLETGLCTGAHEDCRLWYAAGEPVPDEMAHKEAVQLANDVKKQQAKNVAFYNRSSALIAAGVRALSAQIDAILSTFLQPLPERARAGDLNASKAYRLKLVHDPYVFTHPGDEVENNLSVDILLDASSSRATAQEIIAAQAFILAKSLMRCHVPVQISSFRSIKGYTVLERMKSYADADLTRIFRYYAAGWNRDGLAMRAIGKLMEGASEKRVLLVLTDAHPNDAMKMPPEEGSFFTREYDGIAAVNDTIDAVKALKEEGVMTGAIFTGKTSYLENLHAIYGKHYVRIRKTEQLAVAAGALFTSMLREIGN